MAAVFNEVLTGSLDRVIDQLSVAGDKEREVMRTELLGRAGEVRPRVERQLSGYVQAQQAYSRNRSEFRLKRLIPQFRARARHLQDTTDDASALLIQDLDEVVKDQVSKLINERDKRLHAYETLFDTTEAPRLVELDTPPVDIGKAFQDLSSFICGHDTSALGLSGRRGAGKSTLLQRLSKNLKGYYGVVITAPTEYAPSDFVRHIHAEVAKQILLSEGGSDSGPSYRSEVATQRMFIGAILMYGGIALIVLTIIHSKWLSSLSAWGLAGAVGFVVGLYISFAYIMRRRPSSRLGISPGPSPLGGIAAEELVRLRWARTLEQSNTNSFTSLNFSVEDEDKVAVAERDRSYPERVADFKSFIVRCRAERPELMVIVAIDELDKLPNDTSAVRLINGLKDMFHLPGVHFVITVSEDALESFSARGVPVRDAFDSAFDAILETEQLSPTDSELLLRSRAIGFPYTAVLLCHALSGGLPRELIRVARGCVSLRNLSNKPLPIKDLAGTIVHSEIASILSVATDQANAANDQKAMIALSKLKKHEQDKNCDLLPALCELASSDAFHGNSSATAEKWIKMSRALPTYLLCLHTVREYFQSAESQGSWETDLESGRLAKGFDMLARIIGALQLISIEAKQDLDSAREQLHLDPLDPRRIARFRQPMTRRR
jgi:hypothetical protein